MIRESSYVARPKNNASKYVCLGLFGSSLIFFLTSQLVERYSGLILAVALVFITATIYVYNRFVGSEYCYILDNSGGRPTFSVNMRIGKTVRTVARVDTYSISEVRRLGGKEYRAYKCERGVVKYAYFPTMFAREVYLVSIRGEQESADIFIEADNEFAAALDEAIC